MTASFASQGHPLDLEVSGHGFSIHDAAAAPHTHRVKEQEDGQILVHREQQLVAAAQMQDHDAYRQLVEMHQEKILHFCRQLLTGSEDAREACQDTFVRAYCGLQDFRWQRKTRFSTWLFRIALNRCRDQLRSASHRRQQLTDPVEKSNHAALAFACPKSQPDQRLAAREDLEKLQQGIDALPPRLREALILATLDGLSHQQCATILRCSKRAVEGRLRRARRQLIAWWNVQS